MRGNARVSPPNAAGVSSHGDASGSAGAPSVSNGGGSDGWEVSAISFISSKLIFGIARVDASSCGGSSHGDGSGAGGGGGGSWTAGAGSNDGGDADASCSISSKLIRGKARVSPPNAAGVSSHGDVS